MDAATLQSERRKSPMRVVVLEDHFTVPALVRRIDPGAISRRGFRPRKAPANGPNPLELLPDLGERRLKSMDEGGITVQVLSNSGPGPDLVPGPDGVAMATRRKRLFRHRSLCRHHPRRIADREVIAFPAQFEVALVKADDRRAMADGHDRRLR
jgi:hypothetical protein